MATEAQIQANQQNAQKSTGPRTETGKRRSSQNALRHGLRAQPTVLPGENRQQFQAIAAALIRQFRPATPVEWTLLRQLADAEWRMRRVPEIEAGLLFKELNDTRDHYEEFPDDLPVDEKDEGRYLTGCMAANDGDGADVLSKLSRYEARLSQRYFKALKLLQEAQDRRGASPETSVGAKIKLHPKARTFRIETPAKPRNSANHTTSKSPNKPNSR